MIVKETWKMFPWTQAQGTQQLFPIARRKPFEESIMYNLLFIEVRIDNRHIIGHYSSHIIHPFSNNYGTKNRTITWKMISKKY